MRILLSLMGIVGSLYMILKRQQLGDLLGEPEWIHDHGGIYNWIITIAVIIFFWSLAEITNTTDYLFAPIHWILPGARESSDSLLY